MWENVSSIGTFENAPKTRIFAEFLPRKRPTDRLSNKQRPTLSPVTNFGYMGVRNTMQSISLSIRHMHGGGIACPEEEEENAFCLSFFASMHCSDMQ